MNTPQVTPLNAKAMLVKLTVRRANLTKRDTFAEAVIQQEMGDGSLIVSSKLFRDTSNPVNQIMSRASLVYTTHKTNTIPYVDKGPRMLPNGYYMEYSKMMRDLISSVDELLNKHMPNYDTYVQLDIATRQRNADPTKPSRASVKDYPTAEEFREKMGFDLRFTPLPDSSHFLFDVSDSDKQALSNAVKEAEQLARADNIKRMLEPLTHLVDKLNKPIGTEGAIFRDTAITNVVEGLEMARKLNIDDNQELNQVINHLSQSFTIYNQHKDVLRESPVVRMQAASKLDAIAKQMQGFF